MTETEERILMIRASLRCFGFGLAALVPVVGAAFGVVALFHARRAYLHGGNDWNPARKWLLAGIALGVAGLLWLAPFVIYVANLLSR